MKYTRNILYVIYSMNMFNVLYKYVHYIIFNICNAYDHLQSISLLYIPMQQLYMNTR